MMTHRGFLAAIFFCCSAVFTQADYSYTVLNLPGANQPRACGVSGANIAGTYSDSGGYHTFVHDGTGYTTLVRPPGIQYDIPHDISGNNVVGECYDSMGRHGYFHDGASFTVFDGPGATFTCSWAVSGDIAVGEYSDGPSLFGFLYDGATVTPFSADGSSYTRLQDVSGNYVTGVCSAGAFVSDGTTTTYFYPGNWPEPVALSGNHVVGHYLDGESVRHGFFFDGTTITSLTPPGSAETMAEAIEGSLIAGHYVEAIDDSRHAFLYDGTTYTKLDGQGADSINVAGISGNRVVVNWSQNGQSEIRIYSLGGPGDANGDGMVNAADARVLAANWLGDNKGWIDGDFTGDGTVNDLDASILAAHWLNGAEAHAAVPEPSLLALLTGMAVGVVILSRRRT
ncbi:MAG: dockerin type I repeat-containing protein [Pirellulales bacterium]|nr:dockerin type I repeat-containing protein [Pirellulales bacterium]